MDLGTYFCHLSPIKESPGNVGHGQSAKQAILTVCAVFISTRSANNIGKKLHRYISQVDSSLLA